MKKVADPKRPGIRQIIEYKPPVEPRFNLEAFAKDYLWELGDDEARKARSTIKEFVKWVNDRWQS